MMAEPDLLHSPSAAANAAAAHAAGTIPTLGASVRPSSSPLPAADKSADLAAAPSGIAVFDTPIGGCGLAWGPDGLLEVQLPEADGTVASLRIRMQRHFPGLPEAMPPPSVVAAIEGICALLAGEPRDLLEVALDDARITDFHRRVYAITRRIPPGQTRTYGAIAEELGNKTLARAVGQALGANPFAPVVPCHRVLGAKGWQGGFSAPGGVAKKLRMLAIKGALPQGQKALF